MEDVEIRGEILRNGYNSILFKTEDGFETILPREQIAVIQEVKGVTVVLPFKLAVAKGLIDLENVIEDYREYTNSVWRI
jgi:hypothetical protein